MQEFSPVELRALPLALVSKLVTLLAGSLHLVSRQINAICEATKQRSLHSLGHKVQDCP